MACLRSFFLAGAAALVLAACSGGGQAVTLSDAFDLDVFGPHVDDLHSPYVAGAAFEITVNGGAGDDAQEGWTLSSSDPSVMRVTSPLASGSVSVEAGRPGQATLSVLDASGAVLDTHIVTVAIPDRVRLYAQGLLLTGAEDADAEVTRASVVVGGEATFLARYFANGTELSGHGTLTSTATAGITTGTVSPSFAVDRDFLQVTVPGGAMSGTVSLLVDDVIVSELPVAAVPTSAVTHVAILAQNDVGAATGASMALYAHAVDQSSANVFGASFAWGTSADGLETHGPLTPVASAAEGPSDLFFYGFDGTVAETVVARYDGFSPGAVIHARGGSVGSTAAVGCSVAALGAPDASPLLGALGLLLAGAALARRRARASAAA